MPEQKGDYYFPENIKKTGDYENLKNSKELNLLASGLAELLNIPVEEALQMTTRDGGSGRQILHLGISEALSALDKVEAHWIPDAIATYLGSVDITGLMREFLDQSQLSHSDEELLDRLYPGYIGDIQALLRTEAFLRTYGSTDIQKGQGLTALSVALQSLRVALSHAGAVIGNVELLQPLPPSEHAPEIEWGNNKLVDLSHNDPVIRERIVAAARLAFKNKLKENIALDVREMPISLPGNRWRSAKVIALSPGSWA